MTCCPKFQSCHASICPLDPEWHKRSNQSDDTTCFYLTESVKGGARTHFGYAGAGVMYELILRVRADIENAHPRIKNTLERAKLTGSRMARKFDGKGFDNV